MKQSDLLAKSPDLDSIVVLELPATHLRGKGEALDCIGTSSISQNIAWLGNESKLGAPSGVISVG
jgi:hypothetical protein